MHDFVYFSGHISDKFSMEEFAAIVDKQQQFADERLAAMVKGVPAAHNQRA
jgi:hypothetical protein